MKMTYMDNAATTYVDKDARKAMERYFSEDFGNPGSFNSYGLTAKAVLEDARKKVAKILNATEDEIIFTGSGTESINLAIKGVARAMKNKGKHIITQKTEHHAVIDSCKSLEEDEGFEVTYLNVDEHGRINLEDLKKKIRKDTILVSIMYANNEIGTIQPVKEIAKICKEKNTLFHTDACQAAGYLSLDTKEIGIDLMTINGSKIYATKGIGVLYLKKGTSIKPIIHGGGQEFGLRSGTENVPSIVCFAEALEIAEKNKNNESKRLTQLRDYMINGIKKNVKKTILNGHPVERLPNNVNMSFLDVEGESLLLHLNENGICAATGSACTSKNLEPSHVLTSIGIPKEIAHSSIRFSLGRDTNKSDVDKVIKIIPKIVDSLRKNIAYENGVKMEKKLKVLKNESEKKQDWFYSDIVKDHFFNPRNFLKDRTKAKDYDGYGLIDDVACGDRMDMWIKVDKKTDRIIDCKWLTWGCASALASTSMLSVMLTENGGMKIDDALNIKPVDIINRLGGLPKIKYHCSVLGDRALRNAIYDYFRKTKQESRIRGVSK